MTNLGWQIKRHRNSGLSFFQHELVSFVTLCSITKSCILTHGPKSITIHSLMNSSCEWEFSWFFFRSLFCRLLIKWFNRNTRICYILFWCRFCFLFCCHILSLYEIFCQLVCCLKWIYFFVLNFFEIR